MDQPAGLADGTIVRRDPRAEFRELAGEGGVLLHLDSADYFGVNAVGALIWELAQDVTFAELVIRLRERLQDVPDRFEDEVGEFLVAMHARSLLVLDGPGSTG